MGFMWFIVHIILSSHVVDYHCTSHRLHGYNIQMFRTITITSKLSILSIRDEIDQRKLKELDELKGQSSSYIWCTACIVD